MPTKGKLAESGPKEQRRPLKKGTDIKDAGRNSDGFQPPDGGWGWVVCLASFWTNGTVFGIINTFGILYVRFLSEYSDRQDDIAFKTAWIGSVNIGLTFIVSPIASILVDIVGIRPVAFVGAVLSATGMLVSSFITQLELLYLTYGVLLGIGSSFVYTPSIVILGHYFSKRLGIVNGLVTFGSGVFTICMPYLMTFLLNKIDLRNTMRVLSAFYAVLIPCSLTWKPLIKKKADTEMHTMSDFLSTESLHRAARGCKAACGKVFNFDVWKTKGYVVWVLSVPVALLGYFIPLVHIVKHTKDILPDANAESLVMCIGVTSAVGRLIIGKLADNPRVGRIRMQQIAFVVFGVCCSCIPFAKSLATLIVIALILGFCDGCFICLLGPICFELLGAKGSSQGFGFLLGLIALPLTIGPPIAGLMYDLMGTYEIAFYVAGTPPLIGALLMFFVPKKSKLQVLQIDEEKPMKYDGNGIDDIIHSTRSIVTFKLENKEDRKYPNPNGSSLTNGNS